MIFRQFAIENQRKLAFDIKIYGEISSGSAKKGFCGLVDVQNQLKDADGQDIRVRINSIGGDVDEGFSIYAELRRYAQENRAKITTLAEGRCASIATVIFLAGDERVVSKFVDPFIHNAWTEYAGNAKDFGIIQKELAKTDYRIAQHYADHTNLSFDEAITLMGADTSLSPEDCVKLRFATKVESVARPMALQKILNKKNNQLDMNIKNKKERQALVNRILEAVGLKPIKNKIVFDAENKEVDFFELGEDDAVIVGAKATIDGQPANGEVLLASGETYVFDNGELTEIKEVEIIEEDIESLQAKIAELEAENNSLKSENVALNQETETAISALKALDEKFQNTLKEKNSFQAKAVELEKKIKGASSQTVADLKNRTQKIETKEKSIWASAIETIQNKK